MLGAVVGGSIRVLYFYFRRPGKEQDFVNPARGGGKHIQSSAEHRDRSLLFQIERFQNRSDRETHGISSYR